MANLWYTSDSHFGHEAIIGYTGRPFANAAEMDEALVENWNRVVRPNDHVYHLGDVAMRRSSLVVVKRLNGKKRLLRGNHDIMKTRDYLNAGFEEVGGVRVHANILFSHFPVHPGSLGRFIGNVHGHLHEKPSPFGMYLNVSVEQTNYTPVSLDTVIEVFINKRVDIGVLA